MLQDSLHSSQEHPFFFLPSRATFQKCKRIELQIPKRHFNILRYLSNKELLPLAVYFEKVLVEYICKPHSLRDEKIPNLNKFPSSFLQTHISCNLYKALSLINPQPHSTYSTITAIARDHAIRNEPKNTVEISVHPYKPFLIKDRQLVIVLPIDIYNTLCLLASNPHRSKRNILRKVIFDSIKKNKYPKISKHTVTTTTPGRKRFSIWFPEIAFIRLEKNAKKQKTSRNNLIIHMIKKEWRLSRKIETP